jgi:hypothetical protein
MKRPARILVFVLLATAGNLILTVFFFVAFLGLYGLSLGRILKLESAAPVIIVAFLGAVALTAVVYRKLIARMRTRWRLEDKLGLDPGKR